MTTEMKITKRITPFCSNSFIEHYDTETLIKILYSDDIIKETPKWSERKQVEKMLTNCFKKSSDVKPFTKKNLATLFHNRFSMLKNTSKVNYIYKKTRPIGRVYPVDALGLCQLRCPLRHSLCKDVYVDIDMVNAHPAILNQLFKNQYSMLNDYVNDRDKYFKLICDHYATYDIVIDYKTPSGRKICKDFFIIPLLYFGQYTTWAIESDIPVGIPPPDFYKEFKKEMFDIGTKLVNANADLARDIEKEKKENKEHENTMGSVISWFCQEWERRILEVIYDVLKKQKLIKKDNAVLCFDGLMILMSDLFDTEEKQQYIINKCEVEVFNILKLSINLKVKEFDEPIPCELLDFEIPDPADIVEKVETIEGKSKDMIDLFEKLFRLGGIETRRGIAELVNELYEKHFIYHEKEWYGWDKIKNKWEKSVQPLKHCIMYDIQIYLEAQLKQYDDPDKIYSSAVSEKFNIYKGKTENVIKSFLCNIVEVDFIVKTCEVIMADNLLQFDFNKNLFGCNNGVYDIETDVFRPYKFDDYVTLSCGFDFEDLRDGQAKRPITERDRECFDNIEKVLSQIFPAEDIKKLVMLILSSAISGNCIEKFFMFYGIGGNGKGWIDEFMKFCLGDYFYEGDITILTQAKKGGGSANPDLAHIDKKRYLLFKEPSKHCTIENNNMKDMTGGGCVKARHLYSSKTDCILHNTTVMECNQKIKLKDDPTRGDIRRLVGIDFESVFTDVKSDVNESKHIYLANPLLKEDVWKVKHRVYFLNMLFKMVQILKKENYSFDSFIPTSVKNNSEAYLLGCFDIHSIFVNNYEQVIFDEKDAIKPYVSLQDISKKLKYSAEFRDLSKEKKRDMTDKAIYEFFKTNAMYKSSFVEKYQYKNADGKQTVARNVIMGWTVIEEEKEEIEEEDNKAE